MFVSAYLGCGPRADGRTGIRVPRVRAEDAGSHAARGLERGAGICASHWRAGAARLAGRSGVWRAGAAGCLRSDARCELFSRGAAHDGLAIEKYGDAEGGGFFDRASRCAADGRAGCPPQAVPGFADAGSNSVAAMALTRMHAYTGDGDITIGRRRRSKHSRASRRNTDCSRRPTAWPRRCFREHPTQVVITGPAGDADRAEARGSSQRRVSVRQICVAGDAGIVAGESAGGAAADASAFAE